MGNGEPRSGAASGLFLIGRNSRGNWVAQDSGGLRGGLFVDRIQHLAAGFPSLQGGKECRRT
jgi:hypothetical protein